MPYVKGLGVRVRQLVAGVDHWRTVVGQCHCECLVYSQTVDDFGLLQVVAAHFEGLPLLEVKA